MSKYKKALIIDDDEIFAIVAKSNMEDIDFAEQIITFPDGSDAIEYLQNLQTENFPDFILLDINMNFMDAWEFLEELKLFHKELTANIHITSSSINPSDIEKAKDNNYVQSFISKPISIDFLNLLCKNNK